MQQPVVGILMLKTGFPRPAGDIGNERTWPFPVLYETVDLATVDRVVNRSPPLDILLEPFVEAGLRLVDAGASLITTSCGFLILLQADLSARLPVPVATSSLLQIPLVQTTLPEGRQVGVITVDAANLTKAHLRAAGAPEDTPVVGTEGGRELTKVIMSDLAELDVAAAEVDVVQAGERLLANTPSTGAVVLECTNMAPYASALQRHIGRPVYDIVSLIGWFQGGANPRTWPDKATSRGEKHVGRNSD